MKYIVFKISGPIPQEIPIIFPNHLVHLSVAKALSKVVGTSHIVAAGECSLFNVDSDTFSGSSVTIGISSRGKRDGNLVKFCDYGAGF